MQTIYDAARGAKLPWFSIEARNSELDDFERLPQQKIDICLNCEYAASHCEMCGEWNVRKEGRPRKEYDHDLLMEMLQLRRCNKEICTALGISERTLRRVKQALN